MIRTVLIFLVLASSPAIAQPVIGIRAQKTEDYFSTSSLSKVGNDG